MGSLASALGLTCCIACGILVLSSLTRDWTYGSGIERQILSQGTTREVPRCRFFCLCLLSSSSCLHLPSLPIIVFCLQHLPCLDWSFSSFMCHQYEANYSKFEELCSPVSTLYLLSFLPFFHSIPYFFKEGYCSIADLQRCVNSAARHSGPVLHIYVFFFHALLHYGISQDIHHGSPCRPVGPSCFSILCGEVCICSARTPLLPSPRPFLTTTMSLFFPWVRFYFALAQTCSFMSF